MATLIDPARLRRLQECVKQIKLALFKGADVVRLHSGTEVRTALSRGSFVIYEITTVTPSTVSGYPDSKDHSIVGPSALTRMLVEALDSDLAWYSTHGSGRVSRTTVFPPERDDPNPRS